jgi:hypothetical protein
VPDKDEWLFEAIRHVQCAAEEEGIPVSRSDVIREALLKHFDALKELFDGSQDHD